MPQSEAVGGCYCGEVRYAIFGTPEQSLVCHCPDCRRSAGAQSVGWLLVSDEDPSAAPGSGRTRRCPRHAASRKNYELTPPSPGRGRRFVRKNDRLEQRRPDVTRTILTARFMRGQEHPEGARVHARGGTSPRSSDAVTRYVRHQRLSSGAGIDNGGGMRDTACARQRRGHGAPARASASTSTPSSYPPEGGVARTRR
jgi:hypothetical protein